MTSLNYVMRTLLILTFDPQEMGCLPRYALLRTLPALLRRLVFSLTTMIFFDSHSHSAIPLKLLIFLPIVQHLIFLGMFRILLATCI